jgi:hypothetical protein
MKKISGILLLLVYVLVATTLLNERFVGAFNMQNITRWSSLFGILGIGVAFVIITGGIDLSIGSVVGLIGCLLPMMLLGTANWPPEAVASLTAYAAGAELLVVAAAVAAARWRARGDTARDYRAPDRRADGGRGVALAVAAGLGFDRLCARLGHGGRAAFRVGPWAARNAGSASAVRGDVVRIADLSRLGALDHR